MIDSKVMQAFAKEMAKVAAPIPPAATAKKMSAGMKALLGATAATGVAAGVVGEQAKDDIVLGRKVRKQQGM